MRRSDGQVKTRSARDRNGAFAKWLLFFAGGVVVGVWAGKRRGALDSPPGLGVRQSSDAFGHGVADENAAEGCRTPRRSRADVDRSAIPQAQAVSEKPAHERSDVNPAMLGMVLIGLAIGAFAIHASLWWWLNARQNKLSAMESAPAARHSPEARRSFPLLQLSPQRELQEYLAKEEQELHATETTNGAARIPIERAMKLVAEGSSGTATPGGPPTSSLQLQQQRAAEEGDRK